MQRGKRLVFWRQIKRQTAVVKSAHRWLDLEVNSNIDHSCSFLYSKHQWELKFVNCKQFPLFSSLCLTMCLFFFLSNFGRVLLVWLSNSWSQRCFTHFSIPNSPRSITTRLSKPVITAKNTLCLQSKVTDKRMLIKSSSPYHGLCHHRSHEGSWEVVKTDPGIHGELEWQTLCGNCVILSF